MNPVAALIDHFRAHPDHAEASDLLPHDATEEQVDAAHFADHDEQGVQHDAQGAEDESTATTEGAAAVDAEAKPATDEDTEGPVENVGNPENDHRPEARG